MVFEILALAASGATGYFGYKGSRDFTSRKLAFIEAAQTAKAPIAAGAAAFIVALPVVAILPIVGFGTAVVAGVAVGAGMKRGQRANSQTSLQRYD